MSKNTFSYTAAGLAALATPVAAQDFYAGGSISVGTFDLQTGTDSGTASIQGINVFGGARVDTGGGFFLGAELQASKTTGYGDITYEPFEDAQTILQAEIHGGIVSGNTRYFGFVGVGDAPMSRDYEFGQSQLGVIGIGAEVGLSDTTAIRVEAEVGKMSIDGCSTHDDVLKREVSAGVVFSF